jgi:Ricin-type beta-trefoil lectin domain-like
MKHIGGSARLHGLFSLPVAWAVIFAVLITPTFAAAASRGGQSSASAAEDGGNDARKMEDFDGDDVTNPPPFDFSDAFYKANGIDVDKLNNQGARFGFRSNRLTGPPAGPNQVNWKLDSSNTDPVRNNVRILATTGGYKDDTGSPTQFISIIGFLFDQNFFLARDQHGGAGNARGLPMQDIVFNFEAYGALKQVGRDGVFRPTPCAPSIGDPAEIAKHNCFPIDSVETPHLRQDWRFATNRNAIDGSAPLSYFGDDLLGMWIITYFWYNSNGFGPNQTPDCKAAMDFLASRNGLTLDGTPVMKTGAELHFVEGKLQGNEVLDFPAPPAVACAEEGNLATDGSDKGPVWLICPSIPDPTQGGIAPDAFLDAVRRPGGVPLDLQIAQTFTCLQKTGRFCPLANGTYRVLNQVSGLFWDGSAQSGGPVQLAALNTSATGTNQQWTFTANRDGSYAVHNRSTGLALADPRASKTSGTPLVQIKGDRDSDDKWIVTPLNNGYRLTSASSRLVVDATTDTPTPGTSIAQATPTGNTAQVWVIR